MHLFIYLASQSKPASTPPAAASIAPTTTQPSTMDFLKGVSEKDAMEIIASITRIASLPGSVGVDIVSLLQQSGISALLMSGMPGSVESALTQLNLLQTLMSAGVGAGANSNLNAGISAGAGSVNMDGVASGAGNGENVKGGTMDDKEREKKINEEEMRLKKLTMIADFDYGDDDEIPKPPSMTALDPFS